MTLLDIILLEFYYYLITYPGIKRKLALNTYRRKLNPLQKREASLCNKDLSKIVRISYSTEILVLGITIHLSRFWKETAVSGSILYCFNPV